MNQSFTVILLGPPGSGKSTQADFLVKEMNAVHIDIGFFLRKTAESNTVLGRKISEIVNKRMGLVSDDVVEEVLLETLPTVPLEKNIVIDGAPRRMTQIFAVDRALSKINRVVNSLISITLSEEESIRRISCRWICSRCDRSFVADVDFPVGKEVCPVCGGALVRRKDDTEEGVQKRYQIFVADTLPIVEYYREKNMLFEIDGKNDSAVISEEIRRYIMSA